MKILFVSTNHEHANDMHINNIHGLMEAAQVEFFGPGYSTTAELEDGLRNYWIRGKYDALILDFALAMLQIECLDIRLAYHWHRYFMSDYSVYESIRYADKIIDEAKKIDAPRLIYYMFDPFTILGSWESCIQKLLDVGFYFWGTGEEFTPEIIETEDTKKIGWNNRYLKFLHKNSGKIISMPHCSVTYKEFCGTPLEKRQFDITVSGNLASAFYPDRERIAKKFVGTKYKVYDSYKNRTLAYRDDENRIVNTLYRREEDKILDSKLKIPCRYIDSQVRREAISIWRESYNVGLRASKMGYADGGLSLQILRKYAEIPARGTLLLCQDIPPLVCFGFKEWENMVPVKPDSVLEICDYLFVNPQKMQTIANAGRNMVFQKHTALIHAKCIMRAVKAIQIGGFRGSYWSEGNFYVN